MRWQIGLLGLVLAILLFAGGLFLGSYRYREEPIHSSASERLRPASADPPASADGTLVYVPGVFESVPRRERQSADGRLGSHGQRAQHQLSPPNHPHVGAVLRFVGKKVRDYLEKPSALPPLGSVEFVIQRSDTAGGPGANFLIRWDGPANVDQPLIEAVMLGQSGNAGVSFTSRGQIVRSAPRE